MSSNTPKQKTWYPPQAKKVRKQEPEVEPMPKKIEEPIYQIDEVYTPAMKAEDIFQKEIARAPT